LIVLLTCPLGQGMNNNTGGSATVCSTCASGYYGPDTTTTCFACSALAGVNPTGGTFASVTGSQANTNCTYTAPGKTITGCATVTSNAVAYSGSAWPASTYSVTASGGYIIANNNTAIATCTQCGAGTYSAGGTATGCTTCPINNYCPSAGMSAPTSCDTVGTGYITDSTGATASSACHAPGFKITLTPMPANSAFLFAMSASGNFTVDWGDGTAVQSIVRTNTGEALYSHNYMSAGNYTVTIGGLATGYDGGTGIGSYGSGVVAAISFGIAGRSITSVSGDLGKIFPILNATSTGTPRFSATFYNITTWTGPIPANLFASLKGAPVSYMFSNTFAYSSGLTSIPGDLFAGIKGAPAEGMFNGTFRNCAGLTGTIPGNLFAGISGAPAASMFYFTFLGDSNLTGIGDGLFNGISGTMQPQMFSDAFDGCTGLTGPSAKSDGQYLYQKWPDATPTEVSYCYQDATGLSDYWSMPAYWK